MGRQPLPLRNSSQMVIINHTISAYNRTIRMEAKAQNTKFIIAKTQKNSVNQDSVGNSFCSGVKSEFKNNPSKNKDRKLIEKYKVLISRRQTQKIKRSNSSLIALIKNKAISNTTKYMPSTQQTKLIILRLKSLLLMSF